MRSVGVTSSVSHNMPQEMEKKASYVFPVLPRGKGSISDCRISVGTSNVLNRGLLRAGLLLIGRLGLWRSENNLPRAESTDVRRMLGALSVI